MDSNHDPSEPKSDVLPLHHRKIEVRTGFEPVKHGFADRSLTTRAPDLKLVEITGLEPVTGTV